MKYLYWALQVLWLPVVGMLFVAAIVAADHASIYSPMGWVFGLAAVASLLFATAMFLSAVIVGPAGVALLLVRFGHAMRHPRKTWQYLRTVQMARRTIAKQNRTLG